jgi:hypothetical protein
VGARVTSWGLAAATVLAIVAGGSAALAGDVLDGLIQPAARDTVEVSAWVEGSPAERDLVVSLVPRGKVKLVADPGILVEPVRRAGVVWARPGPIEHRLPAQAYFDGAQLVRVPLRSADDRPIEADVDYAYCLVAMQCLFGETRVRAMAPEG